MRATIKDIAEELGISVNTVSKALNGKPQVSEKTRNIIIETARRINYRPNETARALVRRELHLAIAYPLEPNEFYSYVVEGIQKAKKDLSDSKCIVHMFPFSSIEKPQELREILIEISKGKFDALVLTCAHRFSVYQEELETIGKMGIPILYNTIFGLKTTGVIGGVRMNTYVTGKIAAEFLSMTIPDCKQGHAKKVALLVGEKSMLVHNECIEGFSSVCVNYNIEITEIYETYEEWQVAYELTDRLFRLHPDLDGIYVTSYNSPGVCTWLEEHPRDHPVIVIGHDLYPKLNEKLRSNILTASLFQNQYEFGKESVEIMYDYLTGARGYKDCTKLIVPQLVISSMIDSFPYYNNLHD